MNSIPYDKRIGKIWLDGKLVEWQDAKLHVLTHGLHYASAVFEGERVYDGKIFKLTEHSERLVYSASRMGFKIPYSVSEIDKFCKEVVKVEKIENGYVRPIAWRGSEMMAVSAQNNTIHFAIAAWVWGSYFDPKIKLNGIKLDISKWKKPAPDSIPWDAKAAGNYMINTLSKHEAEKNGYNDSLMLDYQGNVAEATGANIFFVNETQTEIHTPVADSFLNGITRRTIIEIAKQLQIKVVEKKINLQDLGSYQGCFLTGSAAEVTPVSQIGTYSFKVPELIGKLSDEYLSLVKK
ncbi:MAG: branched-chain amino acid aminotransferase [Pelagibacteraceae bacterium]